MMTTMEYVKTACYRLRIVLLQLAIVQQCALTTDSTWW